MCDLIFSTIFVWNISHTKKNWARSDKKFISVFMWSTLYYCQILMRLAISRQIFEKYSNIVYNEKCILVFTWSTLYYCQSLVRLAISRQIFEKYSNIVYNENPFSGSRVLSFGRTEGQAEKRSDKTKPVVSFHSFANPPSNGDEGQHVFLPIDISVAFNADYWSKDNVNKDYLNRFNKEYVTDDDLNIINSMQSPYALTVYIIAQFMFPRRIFGGHRPSLGSRSIYIPVYLKL
jgi:hypothetical protein